MDIIAIWFYDVTNGKVLNRMRLSRPSGTLFRGMHPFHGIGHAR
jgi:hypothetical protein